MKKHLLVAALLGASSMSAMAQAPLWLRNPQISPNGQEIVFTYKGDIYKVPAAGGQAIQLTTLSSYETAPIWSRDGKQIAFASDRKGNFDVWVMPATGGSAKQLTFNLVPSRIPRARSGSLQTRLCLRDTLQVFRDFPMK